MWNRDPRFPGWEFYYKDRILYGRNVNEGKSGQCLLPDSHPSFFRLDLDNRKTYLVDCANYDPELWLNSTN